MKNDILGLVEEWMFYDDRIEAEREAMFDGIMFASPLATQAEIADGLAELLKIKINKGE